MTNVRPLLFFQASHIFLSLCDLQKLLIGEVCKLGPSNSILVSFASFSENCSFISKHLKRYHKTSVANDCIYLLNISMISVLLATYSFWNFHCGYVSNVTKCRGCLCNLPYKVKKKSLWIFFFVWNVEETI
jgi:hypothetical protein